MPGYGVRLLPSPIGRAHAAARTSDGCRDLGAHHQRCPAGEPCEHRSLLRQLQFEQGREAARRVTGIRLLQEAWDRPRHGCGGCQTGASRRTGRATVRVPPNGPLQWPGMLVALFPLEPGAERR